MSLAIRSRLKHPVMAPVLFANYRRGNYRKVIWLIGDGRSGTTWVSSLLNYNKTYREMFEPFHPYLVTGMDCIVPHQYMRPDDEHHCLLEAAESVFSGRLLHHRVDRNNRALCYTGLLIKDIFANLFACWAAQHFPTVKIVLLVRNPFAVALSKFVKKDWSWLADPEKLLNQQALYQDYLQPFEDLVRITGRSGDFIQQQILSWAIINFIPLRQFRPEQIDILFYEEVLVDPVREVGRILSGVNREQNRQPVHIPQNIIERPSNVAGRESTLLTGRCPVAAWKNELTTGQIDAGYNILSRFGLDTLYDEDSVPDRRVLTDILLEP
jgi:hypothetical protein